MTDNERLLLAKYIAQMSFPLHKYGEHDCMIFAMGWHDRRFGKNKTAQIYTRYHTLKTALKFYRNFLSATGWLAANGYQSQPLDEPILDGDYVVETRLGLPVVWVAFNGGLYTVDETRNLMGVTANTITIDSIWRK